MRSALPGHRGTTITVIAADLGVGEATLSARCKAVGVLIRYRRSRSAPVPAPGLETSEQELARLRAGNEALRATEARLATERDILRSAAKYFAGETNWRAASVRRRPPTRLRGEVTIRGR